MLPSERVSPKHETVMDVTVEQVARVYAKAFMGFAAKAPKPELLVEELEALMPLSEKQAAADDAGCEPAWTVDELLLLEALAAKAGVGK